MVHSLRLCIYDVIKVTREQDMAKDTHLYWRREWSKLESAVAAYVTEKARLLDSKVST